MVVAPPLEIKKRVYQRENLEPVTAEECKREGVWTRWVIERCTEQEKQLFH